MILLTHVRSDFLQPFVGDVVVVDLAGQTKVLSSLLKVAQKPENKLLKCKKKSNYLR